METWQVILVLALSGAEQNQVGREQARSIDQGPASPCGKEGRGLDLSTKSIEVSIEGLAGVFHPVLLYGDI
jgi:hypothetical protein